MSAEYPGAIWYPTQSFWPGHAGKKVAYVIIHGTGGGGQRAVDQANYFAHTDEGLKSSVHFVVGRDDGGEVYQLVNLANSAWGNGVLQAGHDAWWVPNPNYYTISIEHCNDSDNAMPLGEGQKAASFKLIKWLCQTLSIPMRAADASGGITGHYSISPVTRKYCPGNYPWGELWDYLKGGPLDAHFTQVDYWTLKADNGFSYHGMICENILNRINQNSISRVVGLPLEVEHADADGFWRQKTTVGMIVQSGNNAADFHVEALPVPTPTVDPLINETKTWLAALPAGLKGLLNG